VLWRIWHLLCVRNARCVTQINFGNLRLRNWRILTNKEIYASVKKPTIIETIRLNRLRWFGHVQRMEENRIPKRVLYMNFGTTRLRGGPRNR
jgi:hypothetical protein